MNELRNEWIDNLQISKKLLVSDLPEHLEAVEYIGDILTNYLFADMNVILDISKYGNYVVEVYEGTIMFDSMSEIICFNEHECDSVTTYEDLLEELYAVSKEHKLELDNPMKMTRVPFEYDEGVTDEM